MEGSNIIDSSIAVDGSTTMDDPLTTSVGTLAVPLRLTGMTDEMTGPMVSGWAISLSDPSESISLSVHIDNEPIAVIPCDLARENLVAVGFPGLGGFSFPLPSRFLDGEKHVVRLSFPDGKPVPFLTHASGYQFGAVFTFKPQLQIEGFVDGLVGSGIRGWVFRRDAITGEISGNVMVQVSCNGVAVANVIANQIRQDVAQAKLCVPNVGFDFQVPPQFRTGAEVKFTLRAIPEETELQQSPLSLSFPSTSIISHLYSLKELVDDLCSRAWSVQRQLARMLPTGGNVGSGYDAWARRYYADLRERTAALSPLLDPPPLVSIIVPTYDPHLPDFIAAIDSVRNQTYANWELLIVDDASGSKTLTSWIRDIAATDERIKFIRHSRNRGISEATNTALRSAKGDYVVLFDHDDLLVNVAIEVMVRAALESGARMLYSDEDKIDETGQYSEPNLKPDWNYRLLLCQNYVCHLLMIDRGLLRTVGKLRKESDGAQDHDLLLRLSEKCPVEQIQHVPELLYHWRKSATSTASSGEAKPYALQAGVNAVQNHLYRRGFARAKVRALGQRTIYSVDWRGVDEPSVCIVIPFKDQASVTRRCLEEIQANTQYGNWRIVLVDNGSETTEAHKLCRDACKDSRITVRTVREKFNFSRLNNLAVKENPADFYVFLNNDVFIQQRTWLRVLVDEASADPRVAIVGAKLIYPNQTVQHAGVVLGVGGIADHAFRGLQLTDPGYVARAWCAQQFSAVTAACMLCRAEAFREVEGFDEVELAVAYNDVDLCLKVAARGWRVIWTPELVAEHHESLSRGDDLAPSKVARFFHENQVMLERWGSRLHRDPFYHRLFSRSHGIFTELEEIEG